MSAIEWIKSFPKERVVGEDDPTGLTDVANRPLKQVIAASSLGINDDFPGFLARYIRTTTPEGSLASDPGVAAFDTVTGGFYIKQSGSGNTGWIQIGGNKFGNGSPEGTVLGSIGQLYEQRDSETDDHPIWVKRSGTVTNVGWRKLNGFGGLNDGSIEFGDDIAVGVNAGIYIALGKSVAIINASGVNPTVAFNVIGTGSVLNYSAITGTVDDILIIGPANTISNSVGGSCISHIILGSSNTISASGTNVTIIGHGNSFTACDNLIAIGNIITVNINGVTNTVIVGNDIDIDNAGGSDSVYIGRGITHSGGAGGLAVAIGRSIAISASADYVVAIGANAEVSVAAGMAFGRQAKSKANNSIAFGTGADTTGLAGAIVYGSDNSGAQYTILILGRGNLSATPAGFTIRPTDGSGNNIAAGDLTIIAPRSTGSATPGTIIFQTGVATTSGSTLQTAVTNLTITSTGIVVPGTTTFNTITYTWPGADGTPNQALVTDGSGTLSWATAGPVGPEVPPATPGAYDCEFTEANAAAAGFTEDTTVTGPNAVVWAKAGTYLQLVVNGGSAGDLYQISKAYSDVNGDAVEFKCSSGCTDSDGGVFVYLADSSSIVGLTGLAIGYRYNSGYRIEAYAVTAGVFVSAFNTNDDVTKNGEIHIRIRRVSATSYDVLYGPDGISWDFAGNISIGSTTIDTMIIQLTGGGDSARCTLGIDYIRSKTDAI